MLLSSAWFGHRARDLAAQLRAAAALRFAGVAIPPGAERVEGLGVELPEAPVPLGAASWDAFTPVAAAAARPWQRDQADGVLAGLRSARCALLIFPVGPDQQADAAQRGERLLGRIRSGERVGGDEALEELRLRLELEAERQLEDCAGILHHLLRGAPGLRIALAPGASPAALLTPERARLLFAEVRHPGLGLWHDTADAETRAAAGLPPAGAWLDGFGERLWGATLHDYARGRGLLPPGAGAVDWQLLAEYLPRGATRVLHLAPSYPEAFLAEARAVLAAKRLA